MVDQVSGFESAEHAYLAGTIYAELMTAEREDGTRRFELVEPIPDEQGNVSRSLRVRQGGVSAIVTVDPDHTPPPMNLVEEDLPDDG